MGINSMTHLIPLIIGTLTPGAPTTGYLLNPASGAPTDSPSRSQASSSSLSQAHSQSQVQSPSLSQAGGFSRRKDGPTLESGG